MVSRDEFTELKKEIQTGKRLGFRVATGSMEPLIPAGALIEVERLEVTPKRFDILVFFNGTLLICHFLWHINSRIESEGEKLYITCGLTNWPWEDLPVKSSDLLGRVVSHEMSWKTKAKLILKILLTKKAR